MPQIDILVDTNPLAQSVDVVSGRLNATTAAVTAMQAAVIASEKKAADTICENVDKGFYNLIRSQVSSKLAKCFTDMNVALSLILEFSKSLVSTQRRMESDYNRIRREYLKIFKSLDKALENRVSQLDRDALALADARKKVITDTVVKNTAETASSAREISRTKQAAISARLKNKTSRAISFVSSRMHENIDYSSQMDSILENTPNDSFAEKYVPVIVTQEQSLFMQGSYVTNVYYPDKLDDYTRSRIELQLMSQAEQLAGSGCTEAEAQEISREFNNLAVSSGLEPRVLDTLMKIYPWRRM